MPQNKKEVIANRRNEVSKLYLQGIGQIEISEKINISQSQVSRDISYMLKQWQKQQVKNLNDAKVLELEKINKVESESWNRFYDSKEARYLELVLSCIDKRCKIIGVDSKTLSEINQNSHQRIIVENGEIKAVTE